MGTRVGTLRCRGGVLHVLMCVVPAPFPILDCILPLRSPAPFSTHVDPPSSTLGMLPLPCLGVCVSWNLEASRNSDTHTPRPSSFMYISFTLVADRIFPFGKGGAPICRDSEPSARRGPFSSTTFHAVCVSSPAVIRNTGDSHSAFSLQGVQLQQTARVLAAADEVDRVADVCANLSGSKALPS